MPSGFSRFSSPSGNPEDIWYAYPMQNKKTILAQIYRHTSNSIKKLVSENLCTTISARMSVKTSTKYLIWLINWESPRFLSIQLQKWCSFNDITAATCEWTLVDLRGQREHDLCWKPLPHLKNMDPSLRRTFLKLVRSKCDAVMINAMIELLWSHNDLATSSLKAAISTFHFLNKMHWSVFSRNKKN